ncbi:MAG: hypothetical protein M1834_006062 [Cirrosporium novae-zelandiae]|nr:MAG: hypothetical protein M1834_006062 [Cirrosporium novae-zelandiae]
MKRDRVHWVNRRASDKPLNIINQCRETIYPGILTNSGTGPGTGGFKLEAGGVNNLSVSADWSGRVWGRTNCSFNANGTGASNSGLNGGGQACTTGDCGGVVDCQGTGNLPTTIAEFTLESDTGQSFYDISLVDGYNLPLGIVSLHTESGNSSITDIPPNLTNPVCIATVSQLEPQGSEEDATLGTNSSYPLPLDQTVTFSTVESWCPWDLQLDPPDKPGDGVYPYPDDDIQRPLFDPCYSACAYYKSDADCCTGSHNSASKCSPSEYSKSAKNVCPDCYSYAYDDQTSTFIIPSGGGFEIIFCAEGRSTNILATFGDELRAIAAGATVSAQLRKELQNATVIEQNNTRSSADGRVMLMGNSWMAMAVAMGVAVGMSVMF